LRDYHRLRVFENRVLRKIYVPKRDKVTGEWRGLHNEEHYDEGAGQVEDACEIGNEPPGSVKCGESFS
jgi:hypothetical protein